MEELSNIRLDYEERYGPIYRLDTIRSLLSLASHFELPMYQMDLKLTVLNGELK